MIKSRSEILKLNEPFAKHVMRVQKNLYGDLNDWKEGESVVLDDSEKAVKLTKEMADVLNREDEQYFLENRDSVSVQFEGEWQGRTTLVSSSADALEYLSDLGKSISVLSTEYGELIVLGEWNTPWLSQENDYPAAMEAFAYLGRSIDAEFNGGFLLATDEIEEFIPHLFWLTRCNGSLPGIWMACKNGTTVMNICQYGVLHLEFYDLLERDELVLFYGSRGFKEVETCRDPVDFDIFDGRKFRT